MHSVGVPQLIVEKDPIRYDGRSSHCLVGTCCLVYTSADRATGACSVPPDNVLFLPVELRWLCTICMYTIEAVRAKEGKDRIASLHKRLLTNETRHIRQALINNGYPRGVLQHHTTPAPTRPADNHSQGPVITLPYVRGLSEAVCRVLAPLGLKVSFRPNTTLKQLLVRPKDRNPTEELAGVVYQVPCANCPASYVGQTGRCLGKRMKEHRKAVEPGDCTNSALAEHAWSHHHPVDWDKVRVLEQQSRLYHRLTLESIHIRSHPHILNRNNGTLSPVYITPCFFV